ncbi:Zinc finger MYM-type protein 1 [Frankliniella fusca]|uniref:Zinc finger MYM-type protein 1 n=1 Tax=Frankliniella fusca TaxID=407009 RepID=A0AAE1LT25_9NEOP|nr:Zinc finger MYM-type protein 1 [Frankliniella fusca]
MRRARRTLEHRFAGEKKAEKIADRKFATLVACHSSIRSVDHIGEMVNVFGKNSTLEHMKLHRTKCAKLLAKVIAPSLMEEVVKDICENFNTVIAEESNDIATWKQLALCVRYLSESHAATVTHFLGYIGKRVCGV